MDKSFAQAHVMLGENYIEKGMYEEAIAEFETWWTLSEEKTPGEAAQRAAALKDAYRKNGAKGYWQKEIDLALEETKQKHVEPQILSAAYARLDDKEHAFEWLEKAYESHEDMTTVPLDRLRWNSFRSAVCRPFAAHRNPWRISSITRSQSAIIQPRHEICYGSAGPNFAFHEIDVV